MMRRQTEKDPGQNDLGLSISFSPVSVTNVFPFTNKEVGLQVGK